MEAVAGKIPGFDALFYPGFQNNLVERALGPGVKLTSKEKQKLERMVEKQFDSMKEKGKIVVKDKVIRMANGDPCLDEHGKPIVTRLVKWKRTSSTRVEQKLYHLIQIEFKKKTKELKPHKHN